MQWCKKCNRPYGECSNKRAHKRTVKKIKKEQLSRHNQSTYLQHGEDFLENAIQWRAPKGQMPGNQKKSGLIGDKQQGFEGLNVFAEFIWQKLLPFYDEEGRDALIREARALLDTHTRDSKGRVLPHGSLMAADTPSGELPCPGEKDDGSCLHHGSSIDCRKARKAANYSRNLLALLANNAPGTPVTASNSPVGSVSRNLVHRHR